MYNLGEYTRMKINVLHCIICSGWVLLLFCPAIISQTKHFLQKNSSTQINLGEGEGTYSFSSKKYKLHADFLLFVFNFQWMKFRWLSQWKESPWGIFCANPTGREIVQGMIFKVNQRAQSTKGLQTSQFWPQCRKMGRKRKLQSAPLFSNPFLHIFAKHKYTNTEIQIYKYKYRNTNAQMGRKRKL